MKIVKLLILTLILNQYCIRNIYSQEINESTLNFIDSIAAALYPDNEPGISLLISVKGKPVFVKSFGMADLKNKIPLNPDHVMAIGSMTKQFTAVGILQLVNENKLDLNDNINKYLPEYNTHGKTISIENCLTHSSGIKSFTEIPGFDTVYTKSFNEKEMLGFFENEELIFEPGSDFSYSNSGYFILGLIIEKVSGMNYNDFIRKNIFELAGMNNTFFYTEEDDIPLKATGYDGRDTSTYIPTTEFYTGWTVAAGNIKSCVKDLLSWNNYLNNENFIPQDLIQKAFTPNILPDGINSNYGYGWNITDLENNKIIRHGGAINGFLSDGIRISGVDIYITALSNNTGKSPEKLTDKIILNIMNLTDADPDRIPYDKDSFSDYTGSYEVNRDGGRLLINFSADKQYRYIFEENDSLILQRTGGGKFTLLQYDKDKFYIKSSDKRFEFERDGLGNITALNVSSFPVNFGPSDLCLRSDAEKPKEKEEITVSADILKNYTGEFELQPGFNLKIFMDKNDLYVQATGQEKLKLYAESSNKFFLKEVDAQLEFISESDNKVNKLNFTQGQQFECKRIK